MANRKATPIRHELTGPLTVELTLTLPGTKIPGQINYSWAGCSPAMPASISPVAAYFAGKQLLGTIEFQRMASSLYRAISERSVMPFATGRDGTGRNA